MMVAKYNFVSDSISLSLPSVKPFSMRRRISAMSKRLLSFTVCAALTLALAGLAVAQDKTTTTVTTQTTKTIQNADGTYTIIQYPADKEVTVNLTPGTTMSSA